MNQSNPQPRNPNYDFVKGLLLVPLLHIIFAIVWLLISIGLCVAVPFFQTNYNFFLLGIPYFALGLTQISYLLPAGFFFQQRQRSEFVKGIIVSAIVTVLLNGACSVVYLQAGLTRDVVLFCGYVGLIALLIGAIGVALMRRFRSR
jgi:hypothetical protein